MPRHRFIYDPNLKKVVPYEQKQLKESAGPHISKLYPFVSEDFDGTPTTVKSRKHYWELCRKHGVYANELGKGFNIKEL